MRMPRWRYLLPAAVLVTIATPALRALPTGRFLPDPWLLLLLWSVPQPPPESLRRPIVLIVLLGALRSAVSALSPFACWAGLGLALAARHFVSRRLVEQRVSTRFLVGACAAFPPSLLDQLSAVRLGVELTAAETSMRVILVGVLWAVALRPAALPASSASSGRVSLQRRVGRAS